MSLEENKAIIRKAIEEINKRNLVVLDELFAADYVDHTNNLRGLDEVKKFVTVLLKSLDLHITIEDIISEGDKVWVLLTFTATHVGDFHGLAPTGKKAIEKVVQMYRIVNGKIVENLQVSNPLDLLIQLGAVEYTEKAKKLLPEDVK